MQLPTLATAAMSLSTHADEHSKGHHPSIAERLVLFEGLIVARDGAVLAAPAAIA